MGCYDGAEMCKLIGIFPLQPFNNIIPKKDLGLYRDAGLGIFEKCVKPTNREKEKRPYLKIMSLTLP